MRKPEAGKPYPEAWPLRMTVQSDVVHAIRRYAPLVHEAFGDELRSACRNHMWSTVGAFFNYWKRRPNATPVTCKACKDRLARPLTHSEAYVFGEDR